MSKEIKSKIIKEYLDKFPNLQNNTLANKIYEENKLVFNNKENVRNSIRYYKGSAGKKKLGKLKVDKYLSQNKLEEKYNLPPSIKQVYKPYKIIGNKVLIFADVHIPFHDIAALQTMFEYTENKNIDIVLIDGDLMDCYQVSNFNKEPDLIRFNQEREYTKQFLLELKRIYKNAKIYYKFGNHECLEKNTELLTKEGWKNIQDINNNDYIAEYDLITKEISFSNPLKLTTYKSEKLLEIESNRMKQIVTFNHDVIYKNKKIKAKELLNIENLTEDDFPITTTYKQIGINLSNNWIKLLQWVIADGCIVQDKQYINKKRVQFKLSRKDKIENLENLLKEMNIKYTFSLCKKSETNILQPYYIRIYGKYAIEIFDKLNNKKTYPKYFIDMNKLQVKVLLDEMIKTDGTLHDKTVVYSSIKENEIDFLQEIFLRNNYSTSKYIRRQHKDAFGNNPSYVLNIYNNLYNFKVSVKEIEYNDDVYCFTMPKGTLVTRHSGKIGITGNCRFENYLKIKAPEIFGCEEFRLEVLLDLFNMGIQYIEEDRYIELNSDLKVLHMHEYKNAVTSPANPARTTFLRTKANAISAHNHQTSQHSESRIDGEIIGCWSIGCLCGLNPKYMPLNKWNAGFAIYTRDEDKFWHVDNKMIIKGRVV